MSKIIKSIEVGDLLGERDYRTNKCFNIYIVIKKYRLNKYSSAVCCLYHMNSKEKYPFFESVLVRLCNRGVWMISSRNKTK